MVRSCTFKCSPFCLFPILEASNNVYFNQTILNTTTSAARPALNHPEYFEQEPESMNFLSDQLDLSLNDFFKTFNSSESNSSLSTNFSTFNNLTAVKTLNHTPHHIPNSILISHEGVRVFNTNATNNYDTDTEFKVGSPRLLD